MGKFTIGVLVGVVAMVVVLIGSAKRLDEKAISDKRKAFTAGRASLARDIVNNNCGFDKRLCESLPIYLTNAEIDSILEAREK